LLPKTPKPHHHLNKLLMKVTYHDYASPHLAWKQRLQKEGSEVRK